MDADAGVYGVDSGVGRDSGGGGDGGGDGGACGDTTAPTITSSLDDIGFAPGSGKASRTIEFGEPVLLKAGAIEIDPTATITVPPPLPAKGRAPWPPNVSHDESTSVSFSS